MTQRPRSSASSSVRSAFSDDPEMAALVQLFVEEMPQRIDALAEAWSDHDADELFRLAHQLKGAGAGSGFSAISSAAAALESIVSEDADLTKQTRQALEHLVDLCERAVA